MAKGKATRRRAVRLSGPVPSTPTTLALQGTPSGCTDRALALRPIKWRVALAHEKHWHDLDQSNPPPRPTLSDRFDALPGELRAHIFSLLLVQPPAWDIPHTPTCPLLLPQNAIFADIEPSILLSPHTTCVKCEHHLSAWRYTRTAFCHAWRSEWAPEQRNPYMCTDCYDDAFRPEKPPKPLIPCLCARRQNLQTLLVCRKWHAEASHVFYTRNTFCFACPKLFAAYMDFLPPARKTQVRRISLMAYIERSNDATAEPEDCYPGSYWKVWRLLRSLPNLAYLELDSLFLTSNYTLQPLRRLGLRQLRQCRFVQRMPEASIPRPDTFVFPGLARRALIRRFLAAEVAAEIKGQHRRWGRGGREVVKLFIEWEREDRGWRDLVFESEREVAEGRGWWQGGVGNGMFWLSERGQERSREWGIWG